MDRQVLPVASDTVDFMLSHNLAVDQAMLHILFHKLGKQNLWLRAREVFRREYACSTWIDIDHEESTGLKLNLVLVQIGQLINVDSCHGTYFNCTNMCSSDSLSVGYYPGVSAPPGFTSLIVSCGLGEVELALTFEMFIAVNATAVLQLSETTTSFLSITLKR